jgi:hypothetical protein
MGFGTSFKTEVYLNRQLFSHLSEVEERVEDRRLQIEDIKRRLLMFASSNVRDIVPDDWKEEPINWINNHVGDLLSDLIIDVREFIQLEAFVEYVKEGGSIKGDVEDDE